MPSKRNGLPFQDGTEGPARRNTGMVGGWGVGRGKNRCYCKRKSQDGNSAELFYLTGGTNLEYDTRPDKGAADNKLSKERIQ